MCDLEHLCPGVDSTKSEYTPTLTHTSVNTSVRNSIWKKNYINMIWSSLSFGASPSGAVAINNKHTLFQTRQWSPPGCCPISGTMDTHPRQAPPSQHLYPRFPSCAGLAFPGGIKDLMAHWGRRGQNSEGPSLVKSASLITAPRRAFFLHDLDPLHSRFGKSPLSNE